MDLPLTEHSWVELRKDGRTGQKTFHHDFVEKLVVSSQKGDGAQLGGSPHPGHFGKEVNNLLAKGGPQPTGTGGTNRGGG